MPGGFNCPVGGNNGARSGGSPGRTWRRDAATSLHSACPASSRAALWRSPPWLYWHKASSPARPLTPLNAGPGIGRGTYITLMRVWPARDDSFSVVVGAEVDLPFCPVDKLASADRARGSKRGQITLVEYWPKSALAARGGCRLLVPAFDQGQRGPLVAWGSVGVTLLHRPSLPQYTPTETGNPGK